MFENNRLIFKCSVEYSLKKLRDGAYVDVTEVKNSFKHEHIRDFVLNECKKRGIH